MKKITLSLLIFLLFVKPVNAADDLTVTFSNTPMFNLINLSPGDVPVVKTVKIKNTTVSTKIPILKATKTSGNGLESGLDFSIDTLWIGKLSQLFETNISLGPIESNIEKTFTLTATFPKSAGNEFQNKTVGFRIDVGTNSINHLVISEVLYNTYTKKHRGENQRFCRYIFIRSFRNYFDCDDEKYDGQWIELFNPTNKEISLKNWRLESKRSSLVIKPHQQIKPGKFIIIAKNHDDLRPFRPTNKVQILNLDRWFSEETFKPIGFVVLKDSKGQEVDKVSWGNGFPVADINQSIQRLSPNIDTDSFSDWKNDIPTPGF